MSCGCGNDCNTTQLPASTTPGPQGPQGIAGASVIGANVSATGVITFSLSDGTNVVATGSALGPQGPAGTSLTGISKYTFTKVIGALPQSRPGTTSTAIISIPQADLIAAGIDIDAGNPDTFADFTYNIYKEVGSEFVDADFAGLLFDMRVLTTSGLVVFEVTSSGTYRVVITG